ncbi:signal peptidase I [Aquipuribacter nitratireducens]|uniref:Signal peptidase I n=1 Tax=Aquipuribacter nitratireducens TaxID=650104 RepID=A0ABW0GRS9_9MICO
MATVLAPAPLGRHVAGPGGRQRRRASRRRLVAWLLVLVLAAGWFVLLRPVTLGGPLTLVLVSGRSMEPGMHTGDLAVVHARAPWKGEPDVGDVVAFRVPQEDGRGPVVIHRIIERTGDDLVLRGDNNAWVDPWPLTTDDVVGELVLHSPGAGDVVELVARPVNAAALVAALVAFLVLTGPARPRPARRDAP